MKRITALLCVLLCAMFLSSCGDQALNTVPDMDRESEDVIELTLWTFPVGNWSSPTTVNNILAGFHKKYPNIRISVEYLNYNNGDDRISEAAAAGRLPDLVLEGPERLVANWGEKGWMVDLSDLWESEQAGEIYENVRNACRNRDGAYYEFPVCMSAHCMAINYDLFREADALQYIDEENHTWTTDGFVGAVQALTAYGQENAAILYCKNQSGDQGTRALVSNLYGGSFTDDAHTYYTVDSEEFREAFQLLRDLEGVMFDSSLTATDAVEMFCKKETAMCFCWNVSTEIQQTINNPDLDFEVFPIAFPTSGTEPRLEGGIWGFGIFDNGSEERIQAAKIFIRYLAENDDAYIRAVLASSYWPVRDVGNIYENDKLMTEYSIFMPYMGDYMQITPGWTGARAAWWQLLAEIGDGADISEAIRDFPGQ